jgi:hypothetical protein
MAAFSKGNTMAATSTSTSNLPRPPARLPAVFRTFLFGIVWMVVATVMMITVDESQITATFGGLGFAPEYYPASNATSTEYSTATNATLSRTNINTSTSTNTSRTKIVGYADYLYKEHAIRWYRRLESLGYNNHYVGAFDAEASAYFRQHQIRHEFVQHGADNASSTICDAHDLINLKKGKGKKHYSHEGMTESKRKQLYRRRIFASRWRHVLDQLRQGHHVLLQDVDNIFNRFVDMATFEVGVFDAIHAFSGGVPSFPRNIFYITGFNICGGMSWLRSSPGVIELVEELVKRCGCSMQRLNCSCICDDQVVLNSLVQTDDTYKYTWDRKYPKPGSTDEQLRNGGLTGYCNQTKHKVQILDHHTAWNHRGIPSSRDKCPKDNWIAMPAAMEDKGRMHDQWDEACATSNISTPAGSV